MAFDLFHPPVDDFTLNATLQLSSGLTSLARPYDEPIAFGDCHPYPDELRIDGHRRQVIHFTKKEGASTNGRPEYLVDLGITFGMRSSRNGKPCHQLLV